MLTVKSGVRLHGVVPQVLFAAERIAAVYVEFGAADCTIASGIEGVHMVGSPHYCGRALDFRLKPAGTAPIIPSDRHPALVARTKAVLGDDYDVLLSTDAAAGTVVLHVEWDPKQPYTVSPAAATK